MISRGRLLTNGRELYALLDQALVGGVNFLTFALLARALGVREFGVFALAWSAVLLAGNLQMSLIVSPMMSIGPKQDSQQASVLLCYDSVCFGDGCSNGKTSGARWSVGRAHLNATSVLVHPGRGPSVSHTQDAP